jgi:hypothetical protein
VGSWHPLIKNRKETVRIHLYVPRAYSAAPPQAATWAPADAALYSNNVRFFLVEKCIRFLFWSKVEAACGLEIVITVIGSPFYTDHMDGSASLGFFPAYLRPCAS